MKFTSSSLLASIALLSASVSIAVDSSGCDGGYCWGSCVNLDEEIYGHEFNIVESNMPYEEGGDWCWLWNSDELKWAECEDGCDLQPGSNSTLKFMCEDTPDACGA